MGSANPWYFQYSRQCGWKKKKRNADSRIWTYAVKHQVIISWRCDASRVQITRLNDSAISAHRILASRNVLSWLDIILLQKDMAWSNGQRLSILESLFLNIRSKLGFLYENKKGECCKLSESHENRLELSHTATANILGVYLALLLSHSIRSWWWILAKVLPLPRFRVLHQRLPSKCIHY